MVSCAVFDVVKVRTSFNICLCSYFINLLSYTKSLFMNANQTISELIETLEQRIAKGEYKDSVHKITLMTTLETVQRILNGK